MIFYLQSPPDARRKKSCKCTKCGLEFSADEDEVNYLKSLHRGRCIYFCSKCGPRFSRQNQTSKKLSHGFCCMKCRKIFHSKRVFESHEKNHLYNREHTIKIKIPPTAQADSIVSVSKDQIEVNVGASTSKVQDGSMHKTNCEANLRKKLRLENYIAKIATNASLVAANAAPITNVVGVQPIEPLSNVSASLSSTPALPLPIPLSPNRMNTNLMRVTEKKCTYICSICSFSFSDMQVMMHHFGWKHPTQVVEFTEIVMSKLKMEVDD